MSQFVAWLDLETAGTNERRDPIIEIGVALCADEPDQPIVDRWQVVVDPGETFWQLFPGNVDDFVVEMHDTNGLWDEVRDGGLNIGTADRRLAEWLKGHAGTRRVVLAGSGVSHFDRRFITAQMPLSDQRFTFWSYDVGSVRRMLGRTAPSIVRPQPTGGKAHRALTDALDHREEWLAYEAALGKLEAA